MASIEEVQFDRALLRNMAYHLNNKIKLMLKKILIMDFEKLETLLHRAANTDEVQFDGKLLRKMAYTHNYEIKLMANKNVIMTFDEFGTLLHDAAIFGNHYIAKYLINSGSIVNAIGKEGSTPLMVAVQHGYIEVIKVLLEAGANIYIVNNNGINALRMALYSPFINCEIIRLLFYQVRITTSTDNEFVARLIDAGCTLHHAVYSRHIQVLKKLASCNYFDINCANKEGKTALYYAARMDSLKMVNILIVNGAFCQGVRDETLFWAARNRNPTMLKILLEAGDDPRTKNYMIHHKILNELYAEEIIKNVKKFDDCVGLLLQYEAFPMNTLAISSFFNNSMRYRESEGINYMVAHVAMHDMIGTSEVASIERCSEITDLSKVQQLENNYKLCQQILMIRMFGKLSLLDLLTHNENKMRLYAQNKTFGAEVRNVCYEQELKTLHNYYYVTLTRRILKAERMVELEKKAISVICDFFEKSHNECYIAAREILSYLSEHHLKNICQLLKFLS